MTDRIAKGMRVRHTKAEGRIRGVVIRVRADVYLEGPVQNEFTYDISNLEPLEPAPPTFKQWRQQLLDLWAAGHDLADAQTAFSKPDAEHKFAPEFATWSGATKDLLLHLGLVPAANGIDYTFKDES